jgi:hypothetical protein
MLHTYITVEKESFRPCVVMMCPLSATSTQNNIVLMPLKTVGFNYSLFCYELIKHE